MLGLVGGWLWADNKHGGHHWSFKILRWAPQTAILHANMGVQKGLGFPDVELPLNKQNPDPQLIRGGEVPLEQHCITIEQHISAAR